MNKPLRYLAVAAIATSFSLGPAMAQDTTLTVGAAGGIAGDTSKKVFQEPFSKETGIAIKSVSAEGNRLAQLEAMVKAGGAVWDIIEVSASEYPIAVKEDLLEPINYDLIDPDNILPDEARKPYAVAMSAWSQILAVRTDKLPEGKKMESWADFWDVETFPGPRALRAQPQDTLEYALLADGVAPEELYEVLGTEEGVDRAFAKLDEIKPYVTVWWESGAQSIQLLSDGEVFYGTSFNGRITNLANSGVPVEIVWPGGAMHLSNIGIPKGAKNVEAAHDYIKFRALNPDAMREYIKVLPYPGYAPGLYEGLTEDVTSQMPTAPANASVQFSADEDFWADHIDSIQERWTEWLLQ